MIHKYQIYLEIGDFSQNKKMWAKDVKPLEGKTHQ